MDSPLHFTFSGLNRHKLGPERNRTTKLSPGPEGARALVVKRGIARVESPEGSQLLEPGAVLYLSSQEPIELTAVEESISTEVIELGFVGRTTLEYAVFFKQHYGPEISLSDRRTLGTFLRRFATIRPRCSPSLEALLVFRWFLFSHKSAELQRGSLGRSLNAPFPEFLALSIRMGFSVSMLARHFRCSTSHLDRQCRKIWDLPVGRLLRECRWLEVRRLIRETTLPIYEIARQSGYASASAFSAAFRQRFDISPEHFRKQTETTGGEPPCRRVRPEEKKKTHAPTVVSGELPVIVPEGPYFHLDGEESRASAEAPYQLALNAIFNSVQWVCTLQGTAVFEMGGERFQAEPGTVILYPQPINAQWTVPDHRSWLRIRVKAVGLWSRRALEAFAEQHGWVVSIPLDSRPVVLARKYAPLWHSRRSEFSPESSEKAFEWLLAWQELVRSGHVIPARGPDMRPFLSRSFSQRVKSVTSYARDTGYSRSYLSRKLKQQWMEHPHPAAFMRHQKLAQAAFDLRETRLSIEEIARRAHYAHARTFIHAFRREFRITPLQYRLKFQ